LQERHIVGGHRNSFTGEEKARKSLTESARARKHQTRRLPQRRSQWKHEKAVNPYRSVTHPDLRSRLGRPCRLDPISPTGRLSVNHWPSSGRRTCRTATTIQGRVMLHT